MEKKGVFREVLWTVLTGLVLIALIFFFLRVVSILPSTYARYTNVLQALLFGLILYVVLTIVLRTFQRILERRVAKKYIRPLVFIISVIGYFIILLVILDILGVNLSSVILGSAFAGAIVGLAAQQILANFFSGILLIWSRPFVPGDSVELNTWQYSYMLPSYPPKYLSRDEFRWKIVGRVDDISMNFTTIIEDDGTVTKLPNSIVIQGAITVNPARYKTQIRTEIPKTVEFKDYSKGVDSIVSTIPEIKRCQTVVEEIGKESYLVKIALTVEDGKTEETRSKLMEKLLSLGR